MLAKQLEIKKEFVGGLAPSSGKVVAFPTVRGEGAVALKIGDGVPREVRGRISNWRTYINVSTHTRNMPRVVGEVTGVDTSDFSLKDVVDMYEEMHKMPPAKLLDMVYCTFRVDRYSTLALRTVFMIWKHHLEELVLRFNHLRTRYIKKNGLDDPVNDMTKLKWKKVDQKHNINSSSRLLLFSLPPKSMDELPGGSGAWPKHDKFHWRVSDGRVSGLIDDFLSSDFLYPGFCPRVPVERLKKLMKFPIDKLLKCMQAMGGTVKIDYCMILSEFKEKPPAKKKAKPIRMKKRPALKQLEKKYGVAGDVAKIRWHTDEFLSFLKANLEVLAEKEAASTRTTINLVGHARVLHEHIYSKV